MVQRGHRPLREKLKDLFAMHRGERRGFLVLLSLCFIAAGWVTWEQWMRPRTVDNASSLEVTWRAMKDSLPQKGGWKERSPIVVKLFAFDPNGLPNDQWLALGLSERQADMIHRYEQKGGRFRTKKDLAKMYAVRPELFAQWEPYIQLPDSLPAHERRTYDDGTTFHRDSAFSRNEHAPWPDRKAPRALVDVNTADTLQLIDVPGIGPAFARGIVKYRDRLGGFHSLDQLAEVYVLRDKPDAVQRLRAVLRVDTSAVRYFGLNTFTAEDLGPHPYAGWKVAKALVAYRKQHGGFHTVNDIKGCVLVTDSIFRRLAPYLRQDQ